MKKRIAVVSVAVLMIVLLASCSGGEKPLDGTYVSDNAEITFIGNKFTSSPQYTITVSGSRPETGTYTLMGNTIYINAPSGLIRSATFSQESSLIFGDSIYIDGEQFKKK